MHETLLQTRIFDVQRRTYAAPDGHAVVRDIVVHPGAVAIIPRLEDGSLVMIHNYRHPVEQELLELPAGTLEPPEEPIQAAARELEEETGYVAGEMEPFMEFFTTPGICTELMRCFIARNLTKTQQRLSPTEQIRVEVVPAERARQAICDGSIRDGKTIAALGAYFLRRES